MVYRFAFTDSLAGNLNLNLIFSFYAEVKQCLRNSSCFVKYIIVLKLLLICLIQLYATLGLGFLEVLLDCVQAWELFGPKYYICQWE